MSVVKGSAKGNADFELVVGVDPKLSLDKMQEGITNLVTSLNKNPPKIQVDFDINKNTLTTLQAQINDICKKLDTTAAVKVTGGGSAQEIAKETAAINDNTRAKKSNANATKQSIGDNNNEIASNKQKNAAEKAYLVTITKLEDAIRKYTKAKHSRNADSREAYVALEAEADALKKNYIAYKQIPRPTTENIEALTTATDNANVSFKRIENTFKANGDAAKSLTDKVGGLAAKFSAWLSVSQVIMAAYRAIKQMVSNVIELDTAMTELKKVTDETDATYNRFLDNATDRAKRLGASLTDVVSASADFARLGYGIEDSEKLADAAIVYKNVGDGIRDINEASESIIATMQAFGTPVEDVMTIVDKFNKVGNNYAISSKGVGDALLRSAAAMNAANNTIDETIALAAASNTIIQDPEKVGTTLKTVSMYLRAAKTEAEDAGESTDGMANSVSELRGEILALTGNKVDIQINDDTFKSTYQILQELSKVWHGLSDISQANILEMIGGKRNANVVAAILENFSVAEDALADSMDSAGSALEENEKHLDSIKGTVSVFKASFQELSQTLVDSDLVKNIINLGTWLINVLNTVGKIVNALGGLNTVLYVTLGVLATIKAQAIFDGVKNKILGLTNIISNVAKKAKGFGETIRLVGLYIKNAFSESRAAGVGRFKSSINALSSGFKTLKASVSGARLAVGTFMVALTVMIGVMQAAKRKQEEAAQKAEEARQRSIEQAQTASTLSDELSTLINKYVELSEVENANSSNTELLTQTKSELIEKLELEEDELDRLIDKYGSYDEAVKQATVDKLRDAERDLRGGISAYEQELIDASGDGSLFSRIMPVVSSEFSSVVREGTDAYKALSELESSFDFNIKTTEHVLGDIKSFSLNVTGIDTEERGSVEGVLEIYEKLGQALDEIDKYSDTEVYKAIYDEYSSMSEAVNNYKSSIQSLNVNVAEQYALNGLIGKEVPKTKEDFDEYRKSVIDAAKDNGEFIGSDNDIVVAIDNILKKQPEFIGFYKDLSSYTDALTESTSQFVNKLTKVHDLDAGLSQLGKIYSDVLDGKEFDWSSILNNEDFTNAFSQFKIEYTNFMKTIANSPSDINACQDAFDELAHAYIANSNAISDVTDETRDGVVAMLEQMGVANAASIVDAQLEYNKNKLKYTTGEYVDMTYAEIVGLYKSCEAGSAAQQVLSELAVAKWNATKNTIDTSADISNLLSMATAANATTASIKNLIDAKILMARAENITKDIASGKSDYNIKYVTQLMQEAQKLASTPIEYEGFNPSDFTVQYDGGSYISDNSSKSNSSSTKEETWFDRQYKAHKHLVAMEQETDETYLKWLDTAYKKAYKEKIISLDDYNKYQEEVYAGYKDLFKDYIGDIEHEISLRESYEGESGNVVALHKKIIERIEQEISDAKNRGLDENSDYIQELQDMLQSHSGAIKDIYEDITDSAKDAIDKLVDYRLDMLKQEIKDEKDALDTKLDNLKDFYDKQKEMLQDKHDEEKYLDEQSEKRKYVTNIKSELAMLENDDSAWAQKRKLELKEELSTAQDELNEFENDHALDLALDALDNAYDTQEAQIKAEMDALEEKLNDPKALFNQALSDIKNNTGGLYEEMLEYNRKHGTGNDEDVKDTYEEAYKALAEYESLYGESYKGVVLPNSTNYKSNAGSLDTEKTSSSNSNNKPSNTSSNTSGKNTSSSNNNSNKSTQPSTQPSLTSGSTIKVKKTASKFSTGEAMASFVPGGSYTVYQVSKDGKEVLIGKDGVYTGWIYKTDIDGYAGGTSNATAGLHEIDEIGSEYLFTSSNGSRYRVLNSGDKVLNAKATDFLYKFANGGWEILENIIKSTFGTNLFDKIAPTTVCNEVSVGGITIQGNTDSRTVSEIRRAQRDNLTDMLKSLNKLNK